MRKRNKKLLAPLAFLVFLIALSVGCSSEGDKPEQTGSATANPTKETGYPNALSYWVPMNANEKAVLKNYNQMAQYKEVQKKTGTKVEFMHPAGDDAVQFNLLIAANKLPDVIYWSWRNVPRGPQSAIQDKTILRLNELIESHAPNLNKYLKENPELKKAISLDDGTIYVVPNLTPDRDAASYIGPIIRKDWLDKVKLGVPTTIDEWYKVLKVFKTTDLNGNGMADEIPLALDKVYLEPDKLDPWSGAWGITSGFYQEDGKVKYGPIQPQYKEYLRTMNQWYSEKLIDEDYLVTDNKLRDSKVTNEQLGALVGYVGSSIGVYMDQMTRTNPGFDLAGAPFPVLKAGDKNNFGMSNFAFNGWGAAITSASKHPEQVIKWLDYAYSAEGSRLFNFGIEGASYKMENGKPKFTDEILKNPDKLSITQALAKYTLSQGQGPVVFDSGVGEQIAVRPQQAKAKQAWGQATGANRIPGVTMTGDEGAMYASIMNDVNTYYTEMVHKFIMGVENIDKFEDFAKKIQGMKIDEAVKIQQAALDRYNNRK
ncbi:MAG: transporter substrate-binding protein [Paenibacillus sp.]|jgi:putative aldouronate transport system substrate-binding protein|nr:transporter substrate-binding protein [Paenibacillus sp.]